jgi:hypothetical protein
VSDLGQLTRLTNLEGLSLGQCDFVNDLSPLTRLPRLRTLSVTGAGMGRHLDVSPLRSMGSLTVVHDGNVRGDAAFGSRSRLVANKI